MKFRRNKKDFFEFENDRKTHVKLYKAGKQWVSSLISSIGLIRVYKGKLDKSSLNTQVVDREKDKKSEDKLSSDGVTAALKGAAALGVVAGGTVLTANTALADTKQLGVDNNLVKPDTVNLSSGSGSSSTSNSLSESDTTQVSASQSESVTSDSGSDSVSTITSSGVSESKSDLVSKSNSYSNSDNSENLLITPNRTSISIESDINSDQSLFRSSLRSLRSNIIEDRTVSNNGVIYDLRDIYKDGSQPAYNNQNDQYRVDVNYSTFGQTGGRGHSGITSLRTGEEVDRNINITKNIIDPITGKTEWTVTFFPEYSILQNESIVGYTSYGLVHAKAGIAISRDLDIVGTVKLTSEDKNGNGSTWIVDNPKASGITSYAPDGNIETVGWYGDSSSDDAINNAFFRDNDSFNSPSAGY